MGFERLPPPGRIIDAGGRRALPEAVSRRIDQIWEAASVERQLFDGRLFDVRSVTTLALRGSFVPYRWWFTQCAVPELFGEVGVHALAVTGCVRAAGGFVVGKRAVHLAVDAGLWELAPAGGVAREARGADGEVNIMAQFHAELQEELGVAAHEVDEPRCVALIRDRVHHTYDVVVEARLGLTGDQLQARSASNEYDAIRVLPEDDVAAVLRDGRLKLAPLSRFILEAGVR